MGVGARSERVGGTGGGRRGAETLCRGAARAMHGVRRRAGARAAARTRAEAIAMRPTEAHRRPASVQVQVQAQAPARMPAATAPARG